MNNKTLELAQDLINFSKVETFPETKDLLAKYKINRIDPIAIQRLINELAFDLANAVIKDNKKE